MTPLEMEEWKGSDAFQVFSTAKNYWQALAQIKAFDYQEACFLAAWQDQREVKRMCLYYKTGAGKSITALITMGIWGKKSVLVITPPSTYDQWIAVGEKLGIKVTCISHAKFRMPGTKLSRDQAVIADEMHLFGGHSGKGWKKLDKLAAGLRAPLILASATPSYNDAERVYCVQHVLHPSSCRGGFIEFLYQNCTTEQNHFGTTPIVTGFLRYPSAVKYLADLPDVQYLEDDLVYRIEDRFVSEKIPLEMTRFGYNRRSHKMIASTIEKRHTVINHSLMEDTGFLRNEIADDIETLCKSAKTAVLIFAEHSSVAKAVYLSVPGYESAGLITGKTSAKAKAQILKEFKDGKLDLLIGTASLATGTDGLDKVCDFLIIVDDTQDDSLRRQLIGRIMPRGLDTDASNKQVHRLLLQ